MTDEPLVDLKRFNEALPGEGAMLVGRDVRMPFIFVSAIDPTEKEPGEASLALDVTGARGLAEHLLSLVGGVESNPLPSRPEPKAPAGIPPAMVAGFDQARAMVWSIVDRMLAEAAAATRSGTPISIDEPNGVAAQVASEITRLSTPEVHFLVLAALRDLTLLTHRSGQRISG